MEILKYLQIFFIQSHVPRYFGPILFALTAPVTVAGLPARLMKGGAVEELVLLEAVVEEKEEEEEKGKGEAIGMERGELTSDTEVLASHPKSRCCNRLLTTW